MKDSGVYQNQVASNVQKVINCQKQADERQGRIKDFDYIEGKIKDAPERHCQNRHMIDSKK